MAEMPMTTCNEIFIRIGHKSVLAATALASRATITEKQDMARGISPSSHPASNSTFLLSTWEAQSGTVPTRGCRPGVSKKTWSQVLFYTDRKSSRHYTFIN